MDEERTIWKTWQDHHHNMIPALDHFLFYRMHMVYLHKVLLDQSYKNIYDNQTFYFFPFYDFNGLQVLKK